MTRKLLGLLASIALFGPVSCLDDVGPDPFTTRGTCVPGEAEECACRNGRLGIQLCTPRGTFGDCQCPGCTVSPDCDECAGCFEACLCDNDRSIDPAVCRSLCENGRGAGDDAGASTEAR